MNDDHIGFLTRYYDHAARNLTPATPSRPRFRPGQRVKLRADLGGGVVTIVDTYRERDLWQVHPATGGDFVISGHAITRAVPTWLPGDVVLVRFTPLGIPYTYVRGARFWPGETMAKQDHDIDRLYAEGKVEPVLQAGGVPFAKERM